MFPYLITLFFSAWKTDTLVHIEYSQQHNHFKWDSFYSAQYSLKFFLQSLVIPLTQVKEMPGLLFTHDGEGPQIDKMPTSFILAWFWWDYLLPKHDISVSEITWKIKNACSLNADINERLLRWNQTLSKWKQLCPWNGKLDLDSVFHSFSKYLLIVY